LRYWGGKRRNKLGFQITQKFNFYDGVLNDKRYFSLVHLGEAVGDLKIDDESEKVEYFSYEETINLEIVFSYRQVLDDLHQAKLI